MLQNAKGKKGVAARCMQSMQKPMPNDGFLQDLQISFRRSWSALRVLAETVQMALACVFELLEYTLPHKLSPAKFAALAVCTNASRTTQLIEELRNEWNAVLDMESKAEAAHLLHSHCRFVLNQSFRELHCCLEKNNNNLTEEVRSTILAWNPPLQSSSNLENVFADMQSAIQRSGKADGGSLANLMAVAIRGLAHRMDSADSGQPLVLDRQDFGGAEVAGLKTKIWSPASATPCN